MRIPGLGGDVMAKLGASPVSLPGGQIYENLVSGAIDATEVGGPVERQLHEVLRGGQVLLLPRHARARLDAVLRMHASWWGKLTKSDQAAIEAAAAMENDVMMAEYNAKNGAALARLLSDHGVKLRKFNDDVYDTSGGERGGVRGGEGPQPAGQRNPPEPSLAARKNVGGWTKISDQPTSPSATACSTSDA